MPEAIYDDITRLASQICKTPMAAITLIDQDRLWCKSTFGVDREDAPWKHEICASAITAGDNLLIVSDTHSDPRFANDPCVTGDPHIRFYAGAPLLTSDGHSLGTLCVMDRKPRRLREQQYETLRTLARQVMALFEQRRTAAALRESNCAREAMEAELKQSNQLFRAAYEKAPIGIALVSPTGQWMRVNQALCDMFGYRAEELLRTTFQALTYPADLETDLRQLQQMLSREIRTYQMEKRYIHQAGHLVWAQLNVSLVWDDDKLRYFVSHVQDISERKHAERAKVGFLAMVSHELRTPVTSVRGAMRLLASGAAGELTSKAQSLVSLADRNADRLHRLVGDILDVEKMESGAFELRKSDVDITQLSEQAAQELTTYAEQYGVSIEMRCLAKGLVVHADPDRLIQVLANLLSNAIKFSPTGAKVEIEVEREHDRARVKVIDHGPGIPEEFRPHVFKKFAQANSAATSRKGGSGLGLNISRAIIEQHGGMLAFHTEVGAGTTFYFELPARPQTEG